MVYVDPYAPNRKVHVCNKFFTVRRPESGDAKGLLECIERAVNFIGISDGQKSSYVGFGCDVPGVDIADDGMKGYVPSDSSTMD